jgi:hypothetical protein
MLPCCFAARLLLIRPADPATASLSVMTPWHTCFQCCSALLVLSLLSLQVSSTASSEDVILHCHVTSPSALHLSSTRVLDLDTWRTRKSKITTLHPQATPSAGTCYLDSHVENTRSRAPQDATLRSKCHKTGLARQLTDPFRPSILMSPFCKNESSFNRNIES